MERLLASASSMVWPVTNCSPIIRMARSVPRRMTGSPPRAIRRVSAAPSPASLEVAVSLPVTTRPQVAALTKSEGLCPTCERQSPRAILSRISASRVALSGMRSSASARHISATPSWLESEYSWMSPSTPPDVAFALSAATSARARSRATAASGSGRAASGSSARTQDRSSRRQAAVIAARRGVCARPRRRRLRRERSWRPPWRNDASGGRDRTRRGRPAIKHQRLVVKLINRKRLFKIGE